VGRHEAHIDDDKAGRPVGEWLRQLRDEADLTWRQIAQVAYVSHTSLSQNADGRLTKNPGPMHAWIEALYVAVKHYDIEMSLSREDALEQTLKLWRECHRHQRELRRKRAGQPPQPVALEPANTSQAPSAFAHPSGVPRQPERLTDRPAPQRVPAEPDHAEPNPGRHRRTFRRDREEQQRITRAIKRRTIRLPAVPNKDLAKRVTPDSLFNATCVSDLVALLNDMLIATGHDVSLMYRRGRLGLAAVHDPDHRWLLDDQVRDVLTGRTAPTPGIIHRIVSACAGTLGDHLAWDATANPILAQLHARGRAHVKQRPTSSTS
jgi:transcriptional regulator with XRE-family HTH domain